MHVSFELSVIATGILIAAAIFLTSDDHVDIDFGKVWLILSLALFLISVIILLIESPFTIIKG
jgi:hypothetical protein